jgi:hypothetical protein
LIGTEEFYDAGQTIKTSVTAKKAIISGATCVCGPQSVQREKYLTLQKEKKLQEQRQAQPVYAAHRWLRWLRRSKSGPPLILLFLLAPSSEKYQTFIGLEGFSGWRISTCLEKDPTDPNLNTSTFAVEIFKERNEFRAILSLIFFYSVAISTYEIYSVALIKVKYM